MFAMFVILLMFDGVKWLPIEKMIENNHQKTIEQHMQIIKIY